MPNKCVALLMIIDICLACTNPAESCRESCHLDPFGVSSVIPGFLRTLLHRSILHAPRTGDLKKTGVTNLFGTNLTLYQVTFEHKPTTLARYQKESFFMLFPFTKPSKCSCCGSFHPMTTLYAKVWGLVTPLVWSFQLQSKHQTLTLAISAMCVLS